MHDSEPHQERGIKSHFHKHFGSKEEAQPTYQPVQAGGPSPYQQAGGGYQQHPPYQHNEAPYQQQQYQQAGGAYQQPPMHQQQQQQQQQHMQAGGPAYPYQPPQQEGYHPYQPSGDHHQPGYYPYQGAPAGGYQQQQQQQQQQPMQGGGQYGEGVKVDDRDKPQWKEENDLATLLKSLEACVHHGGDPHRLVEIWIAEKEEKLNKWRKGMKTGAGVQTFGLGLVTFGLGPIPINMSILSGLNKHIVHTFTLDDERVEGFLQNTWAYGGKEIGKKLATLLAKTALQVGSSSAVGIVPLIGPAISATMTTHKINKISKETMQNCEELVREICQEALRTNHFTL